MPESLFSARSPRDWLALDRGSLMPKPMHKWLNMVSWNWEKRYLNWELEKTGEGTLQTEDTFKLCSGLQWVRAALKMDLGKYRNTSSVLLQLRAEVQNWGGSGREGACEQSAVPTLRLMEEVSCRATYCFLSLGHVYQNETKKKISVGFTVFFPEI